MTGSITAVVVITTWDVVAGDAVVVCAAVVVVAALPGAVVLAALLLVVDVFKTVVEVAPLLEVVDVEITEADGTVVEGGEECVFVVPVLTLRGPAKMKAKAIPAARKNSTTNTMGSGERVSGGLNCSLHSVDPI